MARCRFLNDSDYCGYWDEQLTDAETIRCEAPGGWSEGCYVEDSRGAIFDTATGKVVTYADYEVSLEEQKMLPESLEGKIGGLVNILRFVEDNSGTLCEVCEVPRGYIPPPPTPVDEFLQCTACGSKPVCRKFLRGD